MSRKIFKSPKATYVETKFLGRGGFGAAYLAKTEDMDKEFAIKIHFNYPGKDLYKVAKEESDKLQHFNH